MISMMQDADVESDVGGGDNDIDNVVAFLASLDW